MRKRTRVILITAVLLVIGACLAWVMMDYIVARGIEVASNYVLDVKTSVGAVSIRPFRSSVGIRNLHVGNPEGYKTDRMMVLGSCTVRRALASQGGGDRARDHH